MMLTTFQQVLRLFLFLAIGFILRRASVIPRSASGTLSLLEVNLFIPCLNFLTFSRNFTLEKLSAAGGLMAASLVSVLLTCVVGTLIGRKLSRDPYKQNVCVYSINMPNTSYVGTPLVLALFGSETLMQLLRNGRKAKMEAPLFSRKSGSRDCFSEARTRPARICASPRTAFSSEKRRTRWTAG